MRRAAWTGGLWRRDAMELPPCSVASKIMGSVWQATLCQTCRRLSSSHITTTYPIGLGAGQPCRLRSRGSWTPRNSAWLALGGKMRTSLCPRSRGDGAASPQPSGGYSGTSQAPGLASGARPSSRPFAHRFSHAGKFFSLVRGGEAGAVCYLTVRFHVFRRVPLSLIRKSMST